MGLREQKKEQTRAALIDAAAQLFGEKGYGKATVADIAAGAGVSTRTFFSYFRTKEDVLFAGTDQRLRAITEAFDTIGADSPLEAMHRILDHVLMSSDDLSSPGRLALMLAEPELQAQGLQRILAAQRLIADRLQRAFPDRLDGALSRAVAGAVVGALVGTVLGGFESDDSPGDLRSQLHRALELLEEGLNTLW